MARLHTQNHVQVEQSNGGPAFFQILDGLLEMFFDLRVPIFPHPENRLEQGEEEFADLESHPAQKRPGVLEISCGHNLNLSQNSDRNLASLEKRLLAIPWITGDSIEI